MLNQVERGEFCMDQQEFEPQEQQTGEEIHRPQYPYTWSDRPEQEGMPRDEPPGSYGGRSGSQAHQPVQPQVPWWARPQPQQSGPYVFATVLALAVVLALVTGALGIVGIVLGTIGHILVMILGAIFALLIFAVLLVILVLTLVFRTLGRGMRAFRRYDRRAQCP
jgi:hypothetical protein